MTHTAPPHCPGCRGYTDRWEHDCPGVTSGVIVYRQVTGKLPWRQRLKVLAGRKIVTGTGTVSFDAGRTNLP